MEKMQLKLILSWVVLFNSHSLLLTSYWKVMFYSSDERWPMIDADKPYFRRANILRNKLIKSGHLRK